MPNSRFTYVKNILVPCFVFSSAAGMGTGLLIFLFKLTASVVIGLSNSVYDLVRARPTVLPVLVVGAALLGLAASVLLQKIPDCRGGGIPTAIAILRGLVPFHWLKSIVFVFGSAMLTYLCGVPLGNEGPSVQMGTAVGRGIVRKYPAWDRYIMTGGSCAGFAAATGAPLTGILFAFEEAHRRFSPMLFLVASMAALTASAVMQGLCSLVDMEYTLFGFEIAEILPLRYLWAPLVVGLIVGLCAAVFTKTYRFIRKFLKHTLRGIPFTAKIVVIFVIVSMIGFFSDKCVGSGHGLVDELMKGHGAWYLLIVYFCIRALLLLLANNSDVTGGLFVPTLAFGAILGALCGKLLIAAGLLPAEYYSIMIIMGIASFLSASSRTPLMAVAFSIEALGGLANIIPISIAITIAFLVIETLGIEAFTDTVIESKLEAAHAGKTAQIVDLHVTVNPGSFVVGKEIRDILWPPTCVVLSVHKSPAAHAADPTLSAGDILHIHYQTYDPAETLCSLEALIGHQQDDTYPRIRIAGENHQVPEV